MGKLIGYPPDKGLRMSRALRFFAGKTIGEIAEEDGCSRQAVQKMLAKVGVGRWDGGRSHTTIKNAEMKAERTIAYALKTYGVPWTWQNAERIKSLRASGLARNYAAYRSYCKRNGRAALNVIEWAERRGEA